MVAIAIHKLDRSMSPPPVENSDRRPCGGVTRTQSGSLIYDVSKRPTPAPSSSGADWDGEREENIDVENSVSISGLGRHRPVMPSSLQERDTDLTAEISRLKALMQRIKENDKREHVDGEKACLFLF